MAWLPHPEIDRSIRTRLMAVKAVSDLIGARIYSTAPKDKDNDRLYPFVLMSEASVRPNDTHGETKRLSGEWTLQVYSRPKDQSRNECASIENQIVDALHQQQKKMSIPDGKIWDVRWIGTRFRTALDARTQMASIRFAIEASPN